MMDWYWMILIGFVVGVVMGLVVHAWVESPDIRRGDLRESFMNKGGRNPLPPKNAKRPPPPPGQGVR